MSKNYLVPTNVVVSTCAHFRPYFDGSDVCVRGSGIRSVSGDHYLSYLRTRSTTSLFESVFTFERDEVTCYNTFLSGGCRGRWHSIESYSNRPMCALIIETFSAFFPLKVNLWWEKWEDSPSTLKDDSLSELYSRSAPVQSFHSLPFSLLFLLPLAHFYRGKVLSVPCRKLFEDNVFIWELSNSFTIPTDKFTFLKQ